MTVKNVLNIGASEERVEALETIQHSFEAGTVYVSEPTYEMGSGSAAYKILDTPVGKEMGVTQVKKAGAFPDAINKLQLVLTGEAKGVVMPLLYLPFLKFISKTGEDGIQSGSLSSGMMFHDFGTALTSRQIGDILEELYQQPDGTLGILHEFFQVKLDEWTDRNDYPRLTFRMIARNPGSNLGLTKPGVFELDSEGNLDLTGTRTRSGGELFSTLSKFGAVNVGVSGSQLKEKIAAGELDHTEFSSMALNDTIEIFDQTQLPLYILDIIQEYSSFYFLFMLQSTVDEFSNRVNKNLHKVITQKKQDNFDALIAENGRLSADLPKKGISLEYLSAGVKTKLKDTYDEVVSEKTEPTSVNYDPDYATIHNMISSAVNNADTYNYGFSEKRMDLQKKALDGYLDELEWILTNAGQIKWETDPRTTYVDGVQKSVYDASGRPKAGDVVRANDFKNTSMQLPGSTMSFDMFGMKPSLYPSNYSEEEWDQISSELFSRAKEEAEALPDQQIQDAPNKELTYDDYALVGYGYVGDDPHGVLKDLSLENQGGDILTEDYKVVISWYYRYSDTTNQLEDPVSYIDDLVQRYNNAVVTESSPVTLIMDDGGAGVISVHEVYDSMAELTTHGKNIGIVAPDPGEEETYPNTTLKQMYDEFLEAANLDMNATHYGHNVDSSHDFFQYITPYDDLSVLPSEILDLVSIANVPPTQGISIRQSSEATVVSSVVGGAYFKGHIKNYELRIKMTYKGYHPNASVVGNNFVNSGVFIANKKVDHINPNSPSSFFFNGQIVVEPWGSVFTGEQMINSTNSTRGQVHGDTNFLIIQVMGSRIKIWQSLNDDTTLTLLDWGDNGEAEDKTILTPVEGRDLSGSIGVQIEGTDVDVSGNISSISTFTGEPTRQFNEI